MLEAKTVLKGLKRLDKMVQTLAEPKNRVTVSFCETAILSNEIRCYFQIAVDGDFIDGGRKWGFTHLWSEKEIVGFCGSLDSGFGIRRWIENVLAPMKDAIGNNLDFKDDVVRGMDEMLKNVGMNQAAAIKNAIQTTLMCRPTMTPEAALANGRPTQVGLAGVVTGLVPTAGNPPALTIDDACNLAETKQIRVVPYHYIFRIAVSTKCKSVVDDGLSLYLMVPLSKEEWHFSAVYDRATALVAELSRYVELLKSVQAPIK